MSFPLHIRHRTQKYRIRIGSETVDVEAAGRLEALIEQTTRVPWDDRVAYQARIEDMREAKVREHLHAVRSALLDELDAATIYRRMRIGGRHFGHSPIFPINWPRRVNIEPRATVGSGHSGAPF